MFLKVTKIYIFKVLNIFLKGFKDIVVCTDLCSDALAGAVVQEVLDHLHVVLLGCHVQGGEAILERDRIR